MSKLSLESLVVETFATDEVTQVSAVGLKPSIRYTDCGSCGIACTYVEC